MFKIAILSVLIMFQASYLAIADVDFQDSSAIVKINNFPFPDPSRENIEEYIFELRSQYDGDQDPLILNEKSLSLVQLAHSIRLQREKLFREYLFTLPEENVLEIFNHFLAEISLTFTPQEVKDIHNTLLSKVDRSNFIASICAQQNCYYTCKHEYEKNANSIDRIQLYADIYGGLIDSDYRDTVLILEEIETTLRMDVTSEYNTQNYTETLLQILQDVSAKLLTLDEIEMMQMSKNRDYARTVSLQQLHKKLKSMGIEAEEEVSQLQSNTNKLP